MRRLCPPSAPEMNTPRRSSVPPWPPTTPQTRVRLSFVRCPATDKSRPPEVLHHSVLTAREREAKGDAAPSHLHHESTAHAAAARAPRERRQGIRGPPRRRSTAAAPAPPSTHPHCISNIELQPHMHAPQLICVDNRPLSAHSFGGALPRLFDVQTIVIGGDDIRRVEVHYGSDDTFPTSFSNMSAAHQVRLAFSPRRAAAALAARPLWRALAQAWQRVATSASRISFSPFYASCGPPAGAGPVNDRSGTVKGCWAASRRRALLRRWGEVGAARLAWLIRARAAPPLVGPRPLRVRRAFFVYSSTFAESVVFSIASGVSLSMASACC